LAASAAPVPASQLKGGMKWGCYSGGKRKSMKRKGHSMKRKGKSMKRKGKSMKRKGKSRKTHKGH
jgi:hypothetical protein